MAMLFWIRPFLAYDIEFVRVVMRAVFTIRRYADQAVILEQLLESPAKAVCSILVRRLDHQEDAADLEDGRADERRDAGCVLFAGELGGWPHGREPGEEGVDDPDDGAPGEGLGGEV